MCSRALRKTEAQSPARELSLRKSGWCTRTVAASDLAELDVPGTTTEKLLIAVSIPLEELKMLGIVGAILIGILYGSLGGGIKEFLYYRKVASNPALTRK